MRMTGRTSPAGLGSQLAASFSPAGRSWLMVMVSAPSSSRIKPGVLPPIE
jgi:hypothetical protein